MDPGGKHSTFRRRPMFRFWARILGQRNEVKGKCNTYPCDSGKNEVCDTSTNLCVCTPGFQQDVVSGMLDEEDECSTLFSPCGRCGRCKNTIGNYTCNPCPCPSYRYETCDESRNVCVCIPGYERDDLGDCKDVNEYLCYNLSNPCQNGRTCVNTRGFSTCDTCPCPGPNKICGNNPGFCECKTGYVRSGSLQNVSSALGQQMACWAIA
jgi:hypothetical protein